MRPSTAILALLVAIAAALWRLPIHFAPDSQSYSSASTAANAGMLRHLGRARESQFNILTNWLARPPGARFEIKAADKKDPGAVPVIKLSWCKWLCKATKFPVVVDNKCAACLTLLSLATWSHGENDKPNPPLARLPVYESGMTALAAIPLLYPRRWATADLLQVCCCWFVA
jgi:hypothetical protein